MRVKPRPTKYKRYYDEDLGVIIPPFNDDLEDSYYTKKEPNVAQVDEAYDVLYDEDDRSDNSDSSSGSSKNISEPRKDTDDDDVRKVNEIMNGDEESSCDGDNESDNNSNDDNNSFSADTNTYDEHKEDDQHVNEVS